MVQPSALKWHGDLMATAPGLPVNFQCVQPVCDCVSVLIGAYSSAGKNIIFLSLCIEAWTCQLCIWQVQASTPQSPLSRAVRQVWCVKDWDTSGWGLKSCCSCCCGRCELYIWSLTQAWNKVRIFFQLSFTV